MDRIKKILFMATVLLGFLTGHARAVITGVHIISQGSNSVTLGWNDDQPAASPAVSYTAGASCGTYTSNYYGTGICTLQTVLTVTGLSPSSIYCMMPIDYVCYSNYWETGPTIIVGTIATYTPSPTFSASPTQTSTGTKTATPTNTKTFTASPTSTPTLTSTGTKTATPTSTATPTDTPTSTATPTFTNTWTQTSTITTTSSASPTATPTFTKTWTQTSTVSPTNTPLPTLTSTPTYTKSATPTNTPVVSATPTFTASATPTVTQTSTATPVQSSPIYGVAQERFLVTATGSAQTLTFGTAKILAGKQSIQGAYAMDNNSPVSFASGNGLATVILQGDSSAFEAGLSVAALVFYNSGAQQITLYVPSGMLTNTHVYTVVISYLTTN